MNIHLILVTYAIDPTPLIESLSGDGVTWEIFTHSNSRDIYEALTTLLHAYDIHLHDYRINRGLSRSWNDGLIAAREDGTDVTCILNDDISASFTDLLKIAEAALAHPECGIVGGQMWNVATQARIFSTFALCAVNPFALQTVGYFDQNYWPIYGEDTDWARRAGLTGLKYLDVGETGIVHAGNETIRRDPALRARNVITFEANRAYHISKWGGGYGEERFTHPFDNPAFGLKIEAEQRNDPYPGYSRVIEQEQPI